MNKEQLQLSIQALRQEILKQTEEQKQLKPKYKEAQRKSSSLPDNPLYNKYRLTALHIIYNQMRNRPPHTQDDKAYLEKCWDTKSNYKKYCKKFKWEV